MTNKSFSLIPLIILFHLILVSCAGTTFQSAGSAFKSAQQKNTTYAYDQFLRDYGNSEFAKQAKELREDLKFKQAKESTFSSEFDQYLYEYPNGKYAFEAKSLKEERSFKETITSNSIRDYDYYIMEYPNGTYTPEAKKLREELKYSDGKKLNSITGFDEYLKDYPEGTYAFEARKLREQLQYIKAKESNKISAYDEYLKDNPNGKYFLEIKKLREELKLKRLSYKKKSDDDNIDIPEPILVKIQSFPSDKEECLNKCQDEVSIDYISKGISPQSLCDDFCNNTTTSPAFKCISITSIMYSENKLNFINVLAKNSCQNQIYVQVWQKNAAGYLFKKVLIKPLEQQLINFKFEGPFYMKDIHFISFFGKN